MSKILAFILMGIGLLLGIFIGISMKTLATKMQPATESAAYEKLPRRRLVISIEKVGNKNSLIN